MCLLNAHELSWMAVHSTFFITYKPWLSIRVFLQGCLTMLRTLSALKVNNASFPNCKENQVIWDSTRTKIFLKTAV